MIGLILMNLIKVLPTVLVVMAFALTAVAQSIEPAVHGVRNDLPRPYVTQRNWANCQRALELGQQ